MNKVLLKYDFDFDFVLIAISCPLKDYRLCHFINKHTGLQLARAVDYSVFIHQYGGACEFSCFTHLPEEEEVEFYLFSNKAEENGYLIPEMKTSDYFLMIRNFIDDEDLEHLITALNDIPDVVVASEIVPEKLKSRENLIF